MACPFIAGVVPLLMLAMAETRKKNGERTTAEQSPKYFDTFLKYLQAKAGLEKIMPGDTDVN